MLDLSLPYNISDVDTGLANLNRELRFIACTLARLRHREDAALVFSPSKQSPTSTFTESPKELNTEAQAYSPTTSRGMLKRLFFSPTKATFDFDDIESAPATPAEDDSPGAIERGPQKPNVGVFRRHTTAGSRRATADQTPHLELPLNLATPPRRRPAPGPRPVSWGGDDPFLKVPSPRRTPANSRPSTPEQDPVPIVVDQRSQVVFSIPRKHLSARFATAHQAESLSIQPSHSSDSLQTHHTIYLPAVTVEDFSDFAHFTRTGRILSHPPKAGDPEWHIEHSARRLVAALALSGILYAPEYESAAIAEFEALGPLLDWPEDYVNSIFAATRTNAIPEAPIPASLAPGPPTAAKALCAAEPAVLLARQSIAAIIATKTHGPAKERNVRLGPRRKPAEEGEDDGTRIRSGTFWALYDARCRQMDADLENMMGDEVKHEDPGTGVGMGFVRMDSVRQRR